MSWVNIKKMTKIFNVIWVSLYRKGYTLAAEIPLSVTGTTCQLPLGFFRTFALCSILASVTCLKFLTLIKQFENIIITTFQNEIIIGRMICTILKTCHSKLFDIFYVIIFLNLWFLNGPEHIERFSNLH